MEEPLVFAWIPDERSNFIRELQLCFEQRMYTEIIDLWDPASTQFWESGFWDDYFRCGNIALAAAASANNSIAEAEILSDMGWASLEREDFRTAKTRFVCSLSKFRLTNNPGGESRVLRYIGTMAHRQDRPGTALKYYKQSLRIILRKHDETDGSESIKWQIREAEVHNLMGNLYFKLHDFASSERELIKSVELASSLPYSSRYYLGAPLLNLGRLYFLQGRYDKAKYYLHQCKQLSEELNRPAMTIGALVRLAEVAEADGKIEEAITLATEAERQSGSDLSTLREQAARLKVKVAHRMKGGIFTSVKRAVRLALMLLDLTLASPITAMRTLKYYLSTGTRGALE